MKNAEEMIMSVKKWIQKHSEKRSRKIVAMALICLLACTVSITVYSKYYKTGYNKGMATASGFYFSSEYMKEANMNDISSIEELMNKDEIIDILPITANDKTWSDTTLQFSIDVCNYANQLLYNDKDLNVSYMIEFALLDEPQGASYEVRKGTEGAYQQLKKSGGSIQKACFTGTLQGGKLSWDTYDLKVALTGGSGTDYIPSRILMLAYPTAPSYLVNTKKIAGIITADYNQRAMEITEQGFTLEEDTSFNETNWKEMVKKESALVYQIKTTGNYSGNGTNNLKQRIKITWNPALYELNMNDKYRSEDTTVIDENAGTMTIETMPYASIKFVFFKKSNFETNINSMTLESFKASVQAEKVD